MKRCKLIALVVALMLAVGAGAGEISSAVANKGAGGEIVSGPVRRGDAPAVRRAVRVARLRRRIRLLVPLASRLGGPTNRLAASYSASRSVSPPLANAQSLRRCRGLPLASREGEPTAPNRPHADKTHANTRTQDSKRTTTRERDDARVKTAAQGFSNKSSPKLATIPIESR